MLAHMPKPPYRFLFCYGSNNPQQLADRLGRRNVTSHAAYLEGYERVFRGFSRNWGGGTASLRRKDGAVTFGYVAKVSPRDLDALDRFEGVGLGIYKRSMLEVIVPDLTARQHFAVGYVSRKREFNPPTWDYLEAVADTISAFWQGENGPVTVDDIPIR